MRYLCLVCADLVDPALLGRRSLNAPYSDALVGRRSTFSNHNGQFPAQEITPECSYRFFCGLCVFESIFRDDHFCVCPMTGSMKWWQLTATGVCMIDHAINGLRSAVRA